MGYREQHQLAVRTGFEPSTYGFQIQCSNHSATLPACLPAISSTNVAILLLLFKQAIIAPNKLIGSQHYKRLRRRILIEFHSLSQFTLTTTQ